MESSSREFVIFSLDKQRYALHLSVVKTTVRAVEVTPLPKAPDIVLGVINVKGQIIPVVNLRRRFDLPEREIELSNRLIIARTASRTVAILADAVTGVVELGAQQLVAAEEVLPGAEYVEGILKLPDGLVLIHDLDSFLSLDEESTLNAAMTEWQGDG